MAGLPPLRRLRKTTIFLTVLFLLFFIHRMINFIAWERRSGTEENQSPIFATGVICANIVNKMPFGIDSVFQGNSRLYFYTTLRDFIPEHPDSLRHVWYYGDSLTWDVFCQFSDNHCISSISSELLRTGEWSVDFRTEKKLLANRQFRIDAEGY